MSTSIRVRVAVAAGELESILATSHSDFSSLAREHMEECEMDCSIADYV